MKLYTFIMNYLGGTYASQVQAKNNREAMFEWIQLLDTSQIKGFSESDKDKIIKSEFREEFPTTLDGLKNVWFFMIETKKGMGHVNFISTNRK